MTAIYQCDRYGCDHTSEDTTSSDPWGPRSFIELRDDDNAHVLHFCSWRCIAARAEVNLGASAVEVAERLQAEDAAAPKPPFEWSWSDELRAAGIHIGPFPFRYPAEEIAGVPAKPRRTLRRRLRDWLDYR